MEIDLGNFLVYLFLAISIISIAYNVLLMNVYAVMTASFFSIAIDMIEMAKNRYIKKFPKSISMHAP